MFTGIIETTGVVKAFEKKWGNLELYVESKLAPELNIDQSISHNGVCLTVVELNQAESYHRCTLIKESLDRTNFNQLTPGDVINLERSLKIGDRLDGHFVQGHVDTTLNCIASTSIQGSWIFRFELPEQFRELVIPKGSVCINGVSLTVSSLGPDYFEVSIIPYTFNETNFKTLVAGAPVNIEFDVLGKYFLRHISLQKK